MSVTTIALGKAVEADRVPAPIHSTDVAAQAAARHNQGIAFVASEHKHAQMAASARVAEVGLPPPPPPHLTDTVGALTGAKLSLYDNLRGTTIVENAMLRMNDPRSSWFTWWWAFTVLRCSHCLPLCGSGFLYVFIAFYKRSLDWFQWCLDIWDNALTRAAVGFSVSGACALSTILVVGVTPFGTAATLGIAVVSAVFGVVNTTRVSVWLGLVRQHGSKCLLYVFGFITALAAVYKVTAFVQTRRGKSLSPQGVVTSVPIDMVPQDWRSGRPSPNVTAVIGIVWKAIAAGLLYMYKDDPDTLDEAMKRMKFLDGVSKLGSDLTGDVATVGSSLQFQSAKGGVPDLGARTSLSSFVAAAAAPLVSTSPAAAAVFAAASSVDEKSERKTRLWKPTYLPDNHPFAEIPHDEMTPGLPDRDYGVEDKYFDVVFSTTHMPATMKHCALCAVVYTKPQSRAHHLSGATHKSNMKRYSWVVCRPCGLQFPSEFKSFHDESTGHIHFLDVERRRQQLPAAPVDEPEASDDSPAISTAEWSRQTPPVGDFFAGAPLIDAAAVTLFWRRCTTFEIVMKDGMYKRNVGSMFCQVPAPDGLAVRINNPLMMKPGRNMVLDMDQARYGSMPNAAHYDESGVLHTNSAVASLFYTRYTFVLPCFKHVTCGYNDRCRTCYNPHRPPTFLQKARLAMHETRQSVRASYNAHPTLFRVIGAIAIMLSMCCVGYFVYTSTRVIETQADKSRTKKRSMRRESDWDHEEHAAAMGFGDITLAKRAKDRTHARGLHDVGRGATDSQWQFAKTMKELARVRGVSFHVVDTDDMRDAVRDAISAFDDLRSGDPSDVRAAMQDLRSMYTDPSGDYVDLIRLLNEQHVAQGGRSMVSEAHTVSSGEVVPLEPLKSLFDMESTGGGEVSHGMCFLATYGTGVYVVTAKHVLLKGGIHHICRRGIRLAELRNPQFIDGEDIARFKAEPMVAALGPALSVASMLPNESVYLFGRRPEKREAFYTTTGRVLSGPLTFTSVRTCFAHNCSTSPSVSGAPIFRQGTSKVVMVHVGAQKTSSPSSVTTSNYGTPAALFNQVVVPEQFMFQNILYPTAASTDYLAQRYQQLEHDVSELDWLAGNRRHHKLRYVRPGRPQKRARRCPYYQRFSQLDPFIPDASRLHLMNDTNPDNVAKGVAKFIRPDVDDDDRDLFIKALGFTETAYRTHINCSTPEWNLAEALSEIDGNTSPGFPTEVRFHTKSAYFADPAFVSEHQRYWDSLLGVPQQRLLTANVKSGEILAADKVNKARIVFADDVHRVVATKRLVGSVLKAVVETSSLGLTHSSWSMLGATPFFGTFDRMIRLVGDQPGYEMDGSAWETTFSVRRLGLYCELIARLGNLTGDRLVRWRALYSTLSKGWTITPDGHIVTITGCNGSGTAITSMLSLLHNSATTIYGILEQRSYSTWWLLARDFKAYQQGDDCTIIPSVPFDPARFRLCNLAAFGIHYTCSDNLPMSKLRYMNLTFAKVHCDMWCPVFDSDKGVASLSLSHGDLELTLAFAVSHHIMSFGNPAYHAHVNRYIAWLGFGYLLFSFDRLFLLFYGRLAPTDIRSTRVSDLSGADPDMFKQSAQRRYRESLSRYRRRALITRGDKEADAKVASAKTWREKLDAAALKASVRPSTALAFGNSGAPQRQIGKDWHYPYPKEHRRAIRGEPAKPPSKRKGPTLTEKGLVAGAGAGHPPSRAKRRKAAVSAPVSISTHAPRVSNHMTMSGDKTRYTGTDRLSSVLISDLADYKLRNVAGGVLCRIPIDPRSLGEKMRRHASMNEQFYIDRCTISFHPARSTSSVGSYLGYYDSDPNDEPVAGSEMALKEGAAHKGASGTNIWREHQWAMPPRMRGRFYVEDSGSTPADKRLQEQGTFFLLLDVPLEESSHWDTVTTGNPLVLGSLYIHWSVTLSKATIQPLFYGTAAIFTLKDNATLVLGDATSGNFSTPFYESKLDPTAWVPDVRNNLPVRWFTGATSLQWQSGFLLPAGLYHLSLESFFDFPKSSTGTVMRVMWSYYDSENPTATPIMVTAINGIFHIDSTHITSLLTSVPSAAVSQSGQWSAVLTVPYGKNYVVSPCFHVVSGGDEAVFRNGNEFPARVMFNLLMIPDDFRPVISTPSDDLTGEVEDLRRRLERLEELKESKEEKKSKR